LILAKTTYFPHLKNVQTGSGAHPVSYSMAKGVLSLKVGQQGMKLTTHIHLVSKSRTGGDKPQLPYKPSKHALGTTIPFTFYPEQTTVTQC
jgi:hypothetical protein